VEFWWGQYEMYQRQNVKQQRGTGSQRGYQGREAWR